MFAGVEGWLLTDSSVNLKAVCRLRWVGGLAFERFVGEPEGGVRVGCHCRCWIGGLACGRFVAELGMSSEMRVEFYGLLLSLFLSRPGRFSLPPAPKSFMQLQLASSVFVFSKVDTFSA